MRRALMFVLFLALPAVPLQRAIAAPPASCVGKFAGTWTVTVLATGQTYPAVLQPDGIAHPICPFCTPSHPWTCSGNTYFFSVNGINGSSTLSPDGHTMTGGCCTATRTSSSTVVNLESSSNAVNVPAREPTSPRASADCSTITSRDAPSSGPCPDNAGRTPLLRPDLRGPASSRPLVPDRRSRVATNEPNQSDEPSRFLDSFFAGRNTPEPPVVREAARPQPQPAPQAVRDPSACTLDIAKSKQISGRVPVAGRLIQSVRDAFSHPNWRFDTEQNWRGFQRFMSNMVIDYHSACDPKKEEIARQANDEFTKYYESLTSDLASRAEKCKEMASAKDQAVKNSTEGKVALIRQWNNQLEHAGCTPLGGVRNVTAPDLSRTIALLRSLQRS